MPAIDRAKGFAILCVLFIHASILRDTVVGTYVVYRATSVFFVLFGTTSELWWRAQRAVPWTGVVAGWYRSRLARLLPPFWAVLCVWWLAREFVFDEIVKTKFVVASFLGYAPSIGTSWFVSAILGLIVVFPLVRWAVVRLGGPTALALGLVLLAGSYLYMWDITVWGRVVFHNTAPGDEGGRYFGDLFYFWIFIPQYVLLVVAGIVIAQRRIALATRTVVACALAVVALDLLHRLVADMPRLSGALVGVADPALTVCLLALLARLPADARTTAALEWLGRHSWGMYLGQMLAQSLVFVVGVRPELLSIGARWLMLGYLLVAAWALVLIGTPLRRWLDRTLAASVAPGHTGGGSA